MRPSSDNFYINLVHCVFHQFKLSKMLLISLAFFWASLCKSVLRLAYCFKNGSCLSSNILWIFLIVILNLNKSLSFGSVVCIFLLSRLRINFVVLTRKKFILLSVFDIRTAFLLQLVFFHQLSDNNFAHHTTDQNNQDQLVWYKILYFC